jgi:hypothetical protein
MSSLTNYPDLLKDPDKDLDPFLLELTDLEAPTLVKTESMPALSMLFNDAYDKKEDHQMTITMTLKEVDLPIKSLIATCRIISPSPQPVKLGLWDLYQESLMETGPKQIPFSLSSLDT